jgi:hypothetical protein
MSPIAWNAALNDVASVTSHGMTSFDPVSAASGSTRFLSASPCYVKASSAPLRAHAWAIPHAMERLFATPMIRPRLPAMTGPFPLI